LEVDRPLGQVYGGAVNLGGRELSGIQVLGQMADTGKEMET
jgi:hypothetical protein